MGIRVGIFTHVLHRGSYFYEVPTASEGKVLGFKIDVSPIFWGKNTAGTYITRTKLFKEDNLEPNFDRIP